MEEVEVKKNDKKRLISTFDAFYSFLVFSTTEYKLLSIVSTIL